MKKETLSCPSALRRWLASAVVDRAFHGVLLIWALCCLVLALGIAKFGRPLPWADEWGFTPIACGQQSLSWSWLCAAHNEHRLPLMRLGIYVVGSLSHWNWQAMHYVTLAFMGLGALALLCAARSIRGHSALSDTFLCLVVLSPGQFETTWSFAYSFGAAGGLMCLALSMAAIRWPQRSVKHLVAYLLTVLAITLSGGPPDNLMALGLVGVLAFYFRETASRAWRISAGVGSGLVLAVVGLMLATIPAVPAHSEFISNSVITIVKATAKESVCWLGPPVLHALWPWVFLILLLPGLWVVGRIVRDLLRWRQVARTNAREWMDLVLVWSAAFLVATCIAYGRGRLQLWAFRYMVLTMPIGLVLYLLLLRMRAPLAIPGTLAVVTAIFCGWNWPLVLLQEIGRSNEKTEMMRALTQGDLPLSEVCRKSCEAAGFPVGPVWTTMLTSFMIDLRQNDQSIFRKINRRKRRDGAALPQAWEADSGELGEGWVCQPDKDAMRGRALRVSTAGDKPASAVYHIQIAVAGAYQLCCRIRSPKQQTLTVMVDGSQSQRQTFAASADFQPCVLTVPLNLERGEHDLRLALSPACTDLDLLELIPRSQGNTK